MKIFLSALENAPSSKLGRQRGYSSITDYIVKQGVQMRWNLISYYYVRKKRDLADYIKANSDEVMVDSGAHSFQKGAKVDWLEYTKEYAEFIQYYDSPNVVGFFEMDVDNVIGYDRVLELRKILERVSDKIIPVWHRNRGIADFKKMCERYAGKIVAVTGFKNEDIRDDQYVMFLKEAHKHGCKLHCLGNTRTAILDKVPFDYCDSSSWTQQGIFGRVNGVGQVSKYYSTNHREEIWFMNYMDGMKKQEQYYRKWRKVCKD